MKNKTLVEKTCEAIGSFLNPFSLEMDKLVILSSGATVPLETKRDVLDAEALGQRAEQAFVSKIVNTSQDFIKPVMQLNLGNCTRDEQNSQGQYLYMEK